MATYLVRLMENHEIVGIFAAVDDMELAELVDECCDTEGTEYVEISSGGIYWPNSSAPSIPRRPSDNDNVRKSASRDAAEHVEFDPDKFFAGVMVTESWEEVVGASREPVSNPRTWMPVPGPFDPDEDSSL